MNNYTIFLKEKNMSILENVPQYSFLHEDNIVANFMLAGHAAFSYYKQKTPNIEIVETTKKLARLQTVSNKCLCITTSKNVFLSLLLNQFCSKNKTILYLPKNEVYFDIERTWNIIQKKRDLHEIDTLLLHMESWAKMAYAYRASTSYGINIIKDITY